jgi:hypothetical protein
MQALGSKFPINPLQGSWAEWPKKSLLPTLNLGLNGSLSQKQKEQIRILNAINILTILPVKITLGFCYGWVGQWPASMLMVISAGLVIASASLHSSSKINLTTYREATLFFSFAGPFILTFLLAGYQNSSLAMLWSFLTPMLAILLDRRQTALRWLILFIALNWSRDCHGRLAPPCPDS